MTTYQISSEEKQLLDAAKKVCNFWGHHNGLLIAHVDHQSDADASLIELIDQGAVVVDGNYVRNI